jgi:predicted dehydrogenase
MRTIKLGLIGAGGISRLHCQAVADIPGSEFIVVADISRERAERASQRFNIPHVFEDYHDLLAMDEVEAVVVTTFNQAHRAPTVDALALGKHVLVEKPMAATLDDAVAMTAAAHRSKAILMVALKTRYSPPMQAAQSIADSGALGQIYYCESVAARRCGIPGGSFIGKDTAGIGTVADIGVYSLDAALCLMGHPKPVAVSGIANNTLGKTHKPVMGSWRWDPNKLEVEDFGVAWVRFDTGAAMVFKTAWIMHLDDLGGTFVLGTQGGLRLNPLTLYRHEFGLMTDTKPQDVPEVEDIELFRRQHLAFADAIREGKPSPIPSDQLLLTNMIIQGLIDSAAAGREVEVAVPNFSQSNSLIEARNSSHNSEVEALAG